MQKFIVWAFCPFKKLGGKVDSSQACSSLLSYHCEYGKWNTPTAFTKYFSFIWLLACRNPSRASAQEQSVHIRHFKSSKVMPEMNEITSSNLKEEHIEE